MPVQELDTLVNELLQPLAGPDPAGRWLRYERAYMELSRSREEDDPNLPLGEWERPLVKANWKQVAADCARLLREETKDFQIAAWLCDAWVRLYEMEGLRAGVALLNGLAGRYWLNGWPGIDEGDADRRAAPFVWMNSSLPLTVKLNVPLLAAGAQREQPLRLADWERAPALDDLKGGPASSEPPAPTRQAIRASVKAGDGSRLVSLVAQSEAAAAMLVSLSALLDDRLAQDAPSLSRLQAMVEEIRRAADSLRQELPAPSPAQPPEPPPSAAAPASSPPAAAPAARSSGSGFEHREHAYQVLAAAAAYLESIEPHSPTPYLVRRAVELGQLSLPDMLRQVTADAGSLDKFFSLLGISAPR